MRGKIAFLLLGMALGILMGRFFERKPSELVTADSDHLQSLAEKTTTHATAPLKEFKIVRGEHVEIPRSEAKAEQQSPPVAQPEKTYGVRIEEAVVSELESEREQLRRHAFTEMRDDGWQIHILEQDQALLHSGLSDGDIITHDSIRSQLQIADRTALVNRFVAVLKYMER